MSLVLVNFGEAPIEITSVTASVPGVESSIKTIEDGKRYEVKLTLTGKMPKGHLDAKLKIVTTSKVEPEIELPLRGDVL